MCQGLLATTPGWEWIRQKIKAPKPSAFLRRIRLTVEAVTFDLGGTLFRPWSEQLKPGEAVKRIWQNLYEGGVHVPQNDFLREMDTIEESYWERVRKTCHEQRIEEKVSLALGVFGIVISPDSSLIARAIDRATEVITTIWYDDTESAIQALLDRNLSIGVISNTSWPLPKRDVKFLARFVNVITTSHEHGFRKPHPSIYHTTLDKLGASPSKAIHVGNSENDVLGARNARMKAAFIKREDRMIDADFSLMSLGDILDILDS